MLHSHAVVWMDFKEARVFRLRAEDVRNERIRAQRPYRKVRHGAGSIGGGPAQSDRTFFDETATALAGVSEWLLLGPGIAKHDFLRHVGAHARDLKEKLAAVEAMGRPTDEALIDQVRRFFKAFDPVQPNPPAPAA